MNYKEKYEQALERAKYALTTDMDDSGHWAVNYIFPELKEDNDERIRKGLIKAVSGTFEGNKLFGTDVTREEALAWLEKQCEQPTDKVEPKFKVGDWIVSDYNNVGYIESISETKYNLQCKDGYHENRSVEYIDRCWHLWTIQDAKDGDVLVASDGSIFLFAGVVDCACKYYVALTTDNHVEINKEAKGGYWETSRAVHPATKEQRDLLFQKMKEAGYEWDAEKKALIKTEPKMLDADKVIEWLDDNICNAYDYDGNEISTTLKSKFKKDFGLC